VLTVAEVLAQALQHHRSSSFAEAERLYRLILQADPSHADAHHLLGVLAFQTGRFEVAIQSIGRALALNPHAAVYHYNLGLAQREAGLMALALATFQTALSLQPESADMHNALGNTLRILGRLADAVTHLQQALLLRQDFAEAHNNLGSALLSQGRAGEAIAHLREALRLRPEFPEAHNNLANAVLEEGAIDDAMAHCLEAVRLRPEFVDAHHDLALLLLLKGDFKRGFAEYEWRWKVPNSYRRSFSQPLWDGSPLKGRSILLHAEQGLGDTIQFIRYVPLVRQMGGEVVLECQAALLPLLSGMPGISHLIARDMALPAFDVHAPLLALPGIFRTTLDTIPAAVPYLSPDGELVERWRQVLAEEYSPHAPREAGRHAERGAYTVGIAWQGNPSFPRDRLRSIPLTFFARLAKVGGMQLVNLQKGPGTDQLQSLGGQVPILDLGNQLDEKSGAFMDTAAVMKNLDLVICSDSAVAHLAGAMAVPVWIALPFIPDWRWLLEREDSPWYPTMRLFRQRLPGDWNEVFDRIAGQLSAVS
jgi:tetratricopeptide (TPR) repeat protein